MSFLLDTNICSAHLKRPGGLSQRFFQYSGRLFVSSIALGELYAGAYKMSDPLARLAKIADLLTDLQILPFDELCAEQFGLLRGKTLQSGITVPALDLQIASVALVHDLALVTHNVKDFQHIPGLSVVDWFPHNVNRSQPCRNAWRRVIVNVKGTSDDH